MCIDVECYCKSTIEYFSDTSHRLEPLSRDYCLIRLGNCAHVKMEKLVVDAAESSSLFQCVKSECFTANDEALYWILITNVLT